MPEKLEVIITADDKASSVFRGLGGVLKTGLGVAALGATAAIGAIGVGLGLAVKEAIDAQEVLAQLDAVLASTGGAAGVTAEMAKSLADNLALTTKFSDETILSGENLLLTFTNIGKDVFPDATKIMLDMSQALGQDLKSSAIQLGKALNDPIKGVTALSRVGVNFTEEQKKMIEQLVEAGKVEEAQALILKELQLEFGGSAEAAGATFGGQLTILKNSLLEVAEGVGMALIPVLTELVTKYIVPAIPMISAFAEKFAAWLVPALQQAGAWFGNLMVQLQPIGKWLIEQGLPAFMSFISLVWSQLGPGLVQLGEWARQLAAIALPLLAQAVAFVTDNWKVFKPILAAVGVALIVLMGPIAAVIAAVVLLATAWANNWGGIREKTKAAVDFLKPYIDGFIKWITDLWTKWGPTILAIVKATWDAITAVFKFAVDYFKIVFSAFKSAFEGDWYSFGQKLRQAWDMLWNAIKTVLSTALTNIKNAFKNVDWGAVGRGIIDGIVAGIRNAAQRLVAAAIAAARAALDAVKGFLGLSSPSVVFKGVGINMMKGMAEGVKVSAGLPVSAVTVAAQRTIPRASGSGMVGGGLFIGEVSIISAGTAGDQIAEDFVRELSERSRNSRAAGFRYAG